MALQKFKMTLTIEMSLREMVGYMDANGIEEDKIGDNLKGYISEVLNSREEWTSVTVR